MGLIYNKETSVQRDLKSQSSADYTYLYDNNIEQNSQNELELYTFNNNSDGTFTQVVDQDFVLTQISSVLNSGGTSTSKTNELYIGSDRVLLLIAIKTIAGDPTISEKDIPFPNTLIKKDTELKLIISSSGTGSGTTCNHSFIGYKV